VGDDPFTHRLLVERSATVISPSRDQASWALGKVLARELAAQSVLAAPLVSTDRVRGLLLVSTDRPEHAFTTHDATLAETVARLVANAMELDRLLERVQDRATQAERNRLARELHDSVTQNLYSIHLFANATQLALSAGKIDTVRENVRQIRDQGESALAEMRLLIFELQPPMLEQEGLPGALRERLDLVEARAGVNTSYRVTSERALPKTIEAELYAVATEALNNALKHSRAEQVSVALEYDSQEVRLSIADDGIGFDPEFARGSRGYGIRNMEERVERMNGRLSVETGPGAGTTVRVEVVA
jgi:signal transduction histidine kinase